MPFNEFMERLIRLILYLAEHVIFMRKKSKDVDTKKFKRDLFELNIL